MIKHRSRPPINLLGASSIVPRGPQPATLGLEEASGTNSHASVLKPSNSIRTSRASSHRSLCTRCISTKMEQGPESCARSGPFPGGCSIKRESGTSHPVRLVVGGSLAQKQLHDPATVLLCRFHQRCAGEEPRVRVTAPSTLNRQPPPLPRGDVCT